LIRLPGVGVPYEQPDLPKERKTRADFGIPQDRVVYLSCQSLFKYLPRYDYLFAEIARRVPKALFVFLHDFKDRVTRQFFDRLERVFHRAGLDREKHCLVFPRQGYLDYLSLLLASDIYLDTLGWSGANTTFEAVACGLPVVTSPGEFMRGRHSYAILKMAGVTETIAKDEADYIEKAVKLGLEPDWRKDISSAIFARSSQPYDDRACVKALEDLYRQVVSSRL
jgi:predicted O-linked N-acetylglucosamine transferase (SPINDLY family)